MEKRTEFRKENLSILREVSVLIKESEPLLILTGAGVSVESGVPTFRGKDGLWNRFRAEELATPQAFKENPEMVWKWYMWRRSIIRNVSPNPAHESIAFLESMKKDFLLVTQNVDGLHKRAGSKNVIEIHGNIFISKCTGCGKKSFDFESDSDMICEECGGLRRPDVVWFGESLNKEDIDRAFSFAERASLILVVGTSGVVYPAAHLPYVVKERGGKVVEINIETTPITRIADYFLKGKSGEILSFIVKEIKRR